VLTPRAAWWIAAAALLAALGACALAGPASASSYSGTDDWTIASNTAEVVTNETIVVNGFLFVNVNASLELVNSSLTVMGRLPPVVPIPAPRREAAKAYINGSFTLTNSTLTFYVPFGGPLIQEIRENSPVGLRVGPNANVTLRDFDNNSQTQGDASFFTAYGAGAPANGSYSSFQPGSRFTMLNSSGELLGFRGYPGLEFNGTTVRIEGSWFNNSHNATVFNNCNGAVISNLTLTNVEQGLSFRGGAGHRLSNLNFSGFVLGLQLTGISDVVVSDMAIHDVIGQINYGAWATPGTSFALNNTSGVTVRRLTVQGNLTDPSYEFVRLIEALSSQDLRLEDVDLGQARGLGSLVNSRRVVFEHVIAAGFLDGLTLTNVSDLAMLNCTIVGDAPWAVQATGGVNYAFINYSAGVRNTLWLVGVSNVLVSGADLNATQAGLRAQDGANFDVRGVGVRGVGTGFLLANITHFFADRPVVEFGDYGIEVAFSQDIVFTAPTLVGAPSTFVRRPLFLTNVRDVAITSFTFQGSCQAAGFVMTASNLTLDGFSARTCGEGLDISGASGVVLRDLVLAGAWNGSGLSLSSTTDATVDNLDASDAWGYAVALGAVDRVQVTRVDGRRGGAGGLVMIISRNVAVTDADFSGSGGTAVALFNSSAPLALLRVNASFSRNGVSLLGSPGVSLQDMDVSHNLLVGVDVDPYSPDAGLRNLTIAGNGGDGLFVDANRSAFVDGNISSNGGGGVEGGLHVRVDWTISVAGSIRNDTLHLKGNLVVAAGASFDAQDAVIRVDEGTSIVDPLPPGRLQLDGWVRFTAVTVRPFNQTRAYGITAGPGSRLDVGDSTFEGAGRGDTLSRFHVEGVATISNGTFSGWSGPLDGENAIVDVRRALFSNNTAGPFLEFGTAYLEDVTSQDNDGFGLDLGQLSGATLVRLELRRNAGVGLLAQRIGLLSVRGLNLTGNLMGGATFEDTEFDASGIVGLANLGFGLRIIGGRGAHLADIQLISNSGWGLQASSVPLDVVDLWITFNGGNGIELYGPMVAAIYGGGLSGGSASGLLADGATFTVEGTVFDSHAGPHVWARGSANGTISNASFNDAALDAVVLDGTAYLQILEAAVSGQAGRVIAKENAYAFVLNSSFSGFAAEGSGQVDVAWDMRITVLLGSGSPAEGALVEVVDTTGALLTRALTDADGAMPLLVVLQKNVYSAGRETLYTPHRAQAALGGQGLARKNITVDRYRDITLRLDGTAPEVSMTVHGTKGAGGWYLDGATVTLEASDGGGFGLFVGWRVSGGPWQEMDTSLDFVSAAFMLADEGDVLVEYFAGDGAGNNGTISRAHVLLDVAAPRAFWLVNGSGPHGRNVTLAWGGSDGNGSGLAGFDVDVSFEGGAFASWQHPAAEGSATFSGQEGDYTFRLTAHDASGRVSPSELLHLTVTFSGTLRLAVVGPDRLPLGAASVEIVGANQTQTGAGVQSFRLPEGTYLVIVRAPGFEDKTLTVNITAGNTTDLGEVDLREVPVHTVTSSTGPLLAVVALAAIGGAAALFFIMRSAKRRRQEEWKAVEGPPRKAP
jgi:hypothetical protein